MEEFCLGCGRKILSSQGRSYFCGSAFCDAVCAFSWFEQSQLGRLAVAENRQGALLQLMTKFLLEQGLAYEWFEFFGTYWREA